MGDFNIFLPPDLESIQYEQGYCFQFGTYHGRKFIVDNTANQIIAERENLLAEILLRAANDI